MLLNISKIDKIKEVTIGFNIIFKKSMLAFFFKSWLILISICGFRIILDLIHVITILDLALKNEGLIFIRLYIFMKPYI